MNIETSHPLGTTVWGVCRVSENAPWDFLPSPYTLVGVCVSAEPNKGGLPDPSKTKFEEVWVTPNDYVTGCDGRGRSIKETDRQRFFNSEREAVEFIMKENQSSDIIRWKLEREQRKLEEVDAEVRKAEEELSRQRARYEVQANVVRAIDEAYFMATTKKPETRTEVK